MQTLTSQHMTDLNGGATDWADWLCGGAAFMTVAAFLIDPTKASGAYWLAKAAPMCLVAAMT